jgi:hypothetical protein
MDRDLHMSARYACNILHNPIPDMVKKEDKSRQNAENAQRHVS